MTERNLCSQLRNTTVFTAGLYWWFWSLVVLEDGESGGELDGETKNLGYSICGPQHFSLFALCLMMERASSITDFYFYSMGSNFLSIPLFFFKSNSFSNCTGGDLQKTVSTLIQMAQYGSYQFISWPSGTWRMPLNHISEHKREFALPQHMSPCQHTDAPALPEEGTSCTPHPLRFWG